MVLVAVLVRNSTSMQRHCSDAMTAPLLPAQQLLTLLSWCLLLDQLLEPLSASPGQLPRRKPPLLDNLKGRRFSMLPFTRGALLSALGGDLLHLRQHKEL